jgi:FkbM family methyltransferase
MEPVILVNLQGDVSLNLPGTLSCMSTFVAIEQEDWFEEEIKFVRSFLKPGMKAVDIGASYGFYSATMAKLTGPHGQVWSFEPASQPFEHLQQSIKHNNFKNIRVEKYAITNFKGKIPLKISGFSEINSISQRFIDPDSNKEEFVDTITLDDAWTEFGWNNLDFLKIDAEGEEINIFKGGGNFLKKESPLIMCEFVHTDKNQLLEELSRYNFNFYYLVPSMNLLIPFDPRQNPDPFLINLFCCKPDKAALLEEQGLLLGNLEMSLEIPEINPELWLKSLEKLPFCSRWLPAWSAWQRDNIPDWQAYRKVLNYFFMAYDLNYPAGVRYACLKKAHAGFYTIENVSENICKLQTLARIMHCLGLRFAAAKLIKILIGRLESFSGNEFSEPFLPVCKRFESIDPTDRIQEWYMSSLIEQLEKLNYYSAFFAKSSPLLQLEALRANGFQSNEMERRRQLLKLVLKLQDKPQLNHLLTEKSENNLNPDFWLNY